jgi:hypothetical protein
MPMLLLLSRAERSAGVDLVVVVAAVAVDEAIDSSDSALSLVGDAKEDCTGGFILSASQTRATDTAPICWVSSSPWSRKERMDVPARTLKPSGTRRRFR